jgi:hypothetical protein
MSNRAKLFPNIDLAASAALAAVRIGLSGLPAYHVPRAEVVDESDDTVLFCRWFRMGNVYTFVELGPIAWIPRGGRGR